MSVIDEGGAVQQMHPETKEEINFILKEITKDGITCTDNIASLVTDLTQVIQVATRAGTLIQVPFQLPPLEAPLEEKADKLLTQFAELEKNSDIQLSSFFKRYHSEKIHHARCVFTSLLVRPPLQKASIRSRTFVS